MIRLRWARGDVRLWCPMYGTTGVGFLGTAIVAVAQARYLVSALLLPIGVLIARFAVRCWIILRGDATLSLDSDGADLRHPLFKQPLHFSSDQIHSAWLGPFSDAPSSGWFTEDRFRSALYVSSRLRRGDDADLLVLVFSEPVDIEPALRISRWVWPIHRSSPPLVLLNAHGLAVPALDPEAAREVLDASGLSRSAMPEDVRTWLK